MLNHFDAALHKLAKARHFDQLAEMAAVYLHASAVLIVSLDEGLAVLGRSKSASTYTAKLVDDALAVAPAPARAIAAAASEPVAGCAIAHPVPFSRVINLSMRHKFGNVACLIFPLLPGTPADRLARFTQIARRQLSEYALTQRYRADLRRYIGMLDHMERTAEIGVWETDLTARELFWSDQVFRIYDLPRGEPPTIEDAESYLPEPGRSEFRAAMAQTVRSGAPCDLTLPLVTAGERRRMVRLIASYQQHGPRRWLNGVIQDVTAQHETNKRLWWTANHDTLTSLANRALFNDRFGKALKRRQRTDKSLALVLIDLDHFKEINDTLGHAAGDALLCSVARRLEQCVRSNDTVARTGGDEFSILIEDVDQPDGLCKIVERLRGALKVELLFEETTTFVTLSAGLALAPEHGDTEDELKSAADLALYRVKNEARGGIAVYEPSFGKANKARNRLLGEARQALQEARFVPFYRPQLDIASGRIVGVEATPRWLRGPDILDPSQFVDIMNDHELGRQVAAAVIRRAMVEMAQLNATRSAKIALSVSPSAGEIVRAAFVERLSAPAAAKRASGSFTARSNESVLLDDPSGALAAHFDGVSEHVLRPPQEAFGDGLASLVQVTTAPVCELKIDRCFLRALDEDAIKQEILRNMILVARSLKVPVIVEDVESLAQVRCLTSLGARLLQGHTLREPIPIAALASLLDAQPCIIAAA